MVSQVGWALSIKGTEYKHSIEIRHNGMHTLVVCYLFLFDFFEDSGASIYERHRRYYKEELF